MAGTWMGQGEVLTKGLKYKEKITFTVIKDSPALVLTWHQYTKHAETENPLHSEQGFLKILPMVISEKKHKAELMLTHPFSMNEMYSDASFDFGENVFVAEALKEECFQRGATAKGKKTTGVKRLFKLNESGQLEYDLWLAVDGGELVHHLHGVLNKSD